MVKLATLVTTNCDILSNSLPDWRSCMADAWDVTAVTGIISKDWSGVATKYVSLQGMMTSFAEAVGEETWHANPSTKDLLGRQRFSLRDWLKSFKSTCF
jgi:hypothetical protein